LADPGCLGGSNRADNSALAFVGIPACQWLCDLYLSGTHLESLKKRCDLEEPSYCSVAVTTFLPSGKLVEVSARQFRFVRRAFRSDKRPPADSGLVSSGGVPSSIGRPPFITTQGLLALRPTRPHAVRRSMDLIAVYRRESYLSRSKRYPIRTAPSTTTHDTC